MLRFFELVPGALSWLTLVLMVVAARYFPTGAAVFIILFDTYWLFKTLFLSFHLRSSFKKVRKNLKTNWLDELGGDWGRIYHLVILPMYQEPYEVVRETFESLRRANYPKNKFIIVLAPEERGGEPTKEVAQRIETEFGQEFFKFLVIYHPDGLPNEIPGKGSNQAYAALKVKAEVIDPLNLPYENILVSVFDVDTQILPDYFGRLTYSFLTAPRPQRSSYQPVPLFNNNIYEAPVFARVVALSATFWHLMQQSRPERLTTFSSHSMPFKALVEIGFWQKNVVSEDSRIFWNLFVRYDGDYDVIPMAYPVSMDANVASNFWGTAKNIYLQHRRWTYGAENIPYILFAFLKNPRIPLGKKMRAAFVQIEGFWSLTTNPLVLFAVGWLPLIVGGRAFNATVLSYNLPLIAKGFLTASLFGLVVSAAIAMQLVPKRPREYGRFHTLMHLLQWILVPMTMVVFSAIPGLDAQIRLMLGRYLGFWVTPKDRKLANKV